MKPKNNSGVTVKAVLVGLVLIPLNAYWIGLGSELWYSLHLTSASLFFNTVFSLFLLTALNLAFRRWLLRYALSQGELLVVYEMLVMLSIVCGHTMLMYLLGILAHPFWFATPENEWAFLFWRHIPDWLTVREKGALRGYFEGDSSFYTAEHLQAWLKPVLLWASIIFALFFVFHCMSVLLRKPWTEQEKLSFPIIQLPLEMTSEGFFKNRLLWLGFAIAGSMDLMNGLHAFFPQVPYLHLKLTEVGRYFTEKPFNAIGGTLISFYPFIIGLTFFVPLDLSFSMWFFYLFGKAERIAGSLFGLQGLPRFPYFNEQGEGAWVMLGLLALWGSRIHLFAVIQKLLHPSAKLDDSTEPMRYRWASLGLFCGVTFLTLVCLKAGMSLGVIALYFGIYFAMSLGITYARVAMGPPVHEVIWMSPQRLLVALFGTRQLGGVNLTLLSFWYAFNRCHRSLPQPNQLEAFKIAERAKMSQRGMSRVMLFALAVSIVVSFWVYLDIMYRYGAAARCRGYIVGIGWESFNQLAGWLSQPTGIDTAATGFIGGGAALTLLIYWMRRHFLWWPFHPAGYALGATAGGGVGYFWFPVLLSWAAKAVILRHGGLKAYRKAVPFFLGLVLGEYVIGCFWSLFGVIFSVPVYSVWLS